MRTEVKEWHGVKVHVYYFTEGEMEAGKVAAVSEEGGVPSVELGLELTRWKYRSDGLREIPRGMGNGEESLATTGGFWGEEGTTLEVEVEAKAKAKDGSGVETTGALEADEVT